MTNLDPLWGATITSIELDLSNHRVSLQLKTVEFGLIVRYEATFSGVTEFSFKDDLPDPWNYVEMTQARVETLPNGIKDVEMVLWIETSTLRIACMEYTIQTMPEIDSV